MTGIIAEPPSGGLHFFFRADDEARLRNSAGLLAVGVDVRGEGGFIVLPPSLPAIDRPEYAWEDGTHGSL